MLKTGVFTVLVLLLVGCASDPRSLVYSHVPSDRIYYPIASTDDSTSFITIKRDNSHSGSAAEIMLTVDGQHFVSLDGLEEHTFPIKTGDYVFGIEVYNAPPIGFSDGHVLGELGIKVQEGKHYGLFITWPWGHGLPTFRRSLVKE